MKSGCFRYYKILLLPPVFVLTTVELWARAGGGGGGGNSGSDDGLIGIVLDFFGLLLDLSIEYPPFGIGLLLTIVIFWLVIRYYNKKPQ